MAATQSGAAARARMPHAMIVPTHRVPLFFGLCIGLVTPMKSEPVAAAESVALPRHHRNGGFQNNHLEFEPKSLGALPRWRADALRDGLPKPAQTSTPVVAPHAGAPERLTKPACEPRR